MYEVRTSPRGTLIFPRLMTEMKPGNEGPTERTQTMTALRLIPDNWSAMSANGIERRASLQDRLTVPEPVNGGRVRHVKMRETDALTAHDEVIRDHNAGERTVEAGVRSACHSNC